jgi:hypothetical protein
MVAVFVTFLLPSAATAAILEVGPVTNIAASPNLAVDEGGRSHAVWTAVDGSAVRVYYRSISAAGALGSLTPLSASDTVSEDAAMRIERDGTVHAVWRESAGAPFAYRVHYVRIASDGTVGTVRILSGLGRSPSTPLLAVDAAGTAHVTYQSQTVPPVTDIRADYVSITRAGVVSPELTIPGGAAYVPRVEVAPDGSLVFAWLRDDGVGAIRVQVARMVGGVFTGLAFDVSPPGVSAGEHQLAIDSAGTAHLTWALTGAPAGSRIVQHATVAPGASTATVHDVSATGQDAYAPQIAVDSTRAAHLTWQRSDGTLDRIQYARVPAGAAPGPVLTISGTDRGAYDPRIAVAGDQTAHVVWYRDDTNAYSVQVARVLADAPLGAIETVSKTDGYAYIARIAVDDFGASHVLWTMSYTGPMSVEYNRMGGRATTNTPELTFDARGVDAGPSAPQGAVITNTGNRPIRVTSATLTGPEAARWTIESSTCSAAAIQPDATCLVQVSFDPAARATHRSSLRLALDGAPGVLSIALRGRGLDDIAPRLRGLAVRPGTFTAGSDSRLSLFVDSPARIQLVAYRLTDGGWTRVRSRSTRVPRGEYGIPVRRIIPRANQRAGTWRVIARATDLSGNRSTALATRFRITPAPR